MSSVMLRSEPFKRTGIRFRECMAEDYQLWVDLSEHLRMANIPEYLTFYRRWEDQISTRQLDRQTLSAQLTQQEQLWASGSRTTKPASSPVSPCGPET